MAGGTGGHVFPALALARLLRAASVEVVWLGTARGLEARVVPAENISIEWLSMSGLRGKGVVTLLAAPFKLAHSIWQALRIIRRRNPGLVVGFGGMLFSGPDGHVTTLAVHADHRRLGVASHLLAALARDAVNRGCENLTLEVRASNDAAFGLYERFGFERAGVRKNYCADLGEDAVVMWAREIQAPAFLQRLRAVDDRPEAG